MTKEIQAKAVWHHSYKRNYHTDLQGRTEASVIGDPWEQHGDETTNPRTGWWRQGWARPVYFLGFITS